VLLPHRTESDIEERRRQNMSRKVKLEDAFQSLGALGCNIGGL
jgi:hypothetical protein